MPPAGFECSPGFLIGSSDDDFCSLDVNYPMPANVSADGEALIYSTNAVGDSIPDFAHVGYLRDRVPLPSHEDIPVVLVLNPAVSGDDGSRIQEALDFTAGQPVLQSGFRGAVLLSAGEFRVSSPLIIHASGVVLRGAGKALTTIRATGTSKTSVIKVKGLGHYVPIGSPSEIADAYVPVGADAIQLVNAAHGLQPGDPVIVTRHANIEWIQRIGMDAIPNCPTADRECYQWSEYLHYYELEFKRRVLQVNGSMVRVEPPFVQSIDANYGGGSIVKAEDGRISQVGVEDLQIVSDFDKSVVSFNVSFYGVDLDRYYYDEAHAWQGVELVNVGHAWVASVTCRHLGFACVHIDEESSYITVQDCEFIEPVSQITGARRYAFNVDGQLSLVRRCHADEARHPFVTGSQTLGPNVFTQCTATRQFGEVGPHARWSAGVLFDNVNGSRMQMINRGSDGTGHGWAGNSIVFFNCFASEANGRGGGFEISSPSGGTNYCIGCISQEDVYVAEQPPCCGSGGFFQGPGRFRTDITSLYNAQLVLAKEREQRWLVCSATPPVKHPPSSPDPSPPPPMPPPQWSPPCSRTPPLPSVPSPRLMNNTVEYNKAGF